MPGRVVGMDLVHEISIRRAEILRPVRISDVDHDGQDDLAVATSFPLDLDGVRGAVVGVSLASHEQLWSTRGAVADSWLGASLVGIGDVDGDGAIDVATSEKRDGASDLVVLSGATGVVVWRYAEPGQARMSLDAAGDQDGDGRTDLFMAHAAEKAGAVVQGLHVLSVFDGHPILSRIFEHPEDHGASVSGLSVARGNVPDVDGDGLDDLVVTLGYPGVAPRREQIDLLLSSASLATLRVLNADAFAYRCSRIGDVDGDGIDDFTYSVRPDSGPASLHAMSLVRDDLLWGADGHGCSMTVTYDFDGDSVRDLVGSIAPAMDGPPDGPLTALSGADGSVLFAVPLDERQAGVRVGVFVAQVSDLNGDGAEDWAVTGEGPGRSRIWVYASRVEY